MIRFFLFVALTVASLGDEVRSGRATVELIKSADGYLPGSPVEVAFRVKLDDGWHLHWINPGATGQPFEVEWDLPQGWVAGPLLFPVPERFTSAGNVGFGYEDEVVIPAFITAGLDSKGPVTLRAQASWVTSDESSSVPGEASLEASLVKEVSGRPGKDAPRIAEALKAVPQPFKGATLDVTPGLGRLVMKLSLPDGLDAQGSRVFPATPGVVDPGVTITFERFEDGWRALAKPHADAKGPPEQLDLVLVGGGLKKPLLVRWKAS